MIHLQSIDPRHRYDAASNAMIGVVGMTALVLAGSYNPFSDRTFRCQSFSN